MCEVRGRRPAADAHTLEASQPALHNDCRPASSVPARMGRTLVKTEQAHGSRRVKRCKGKIPEVFDVTHVIGHRGASWDHPENTIAAFTAARSLGADGVELDVRRSSDGYGRSSRCSSRRRAGDDGPLRGSGCPTPYPASTRHWLRPRPCRSTSRSRTARGSRGSTALGPYADSTLEVIAESKVDCLVSSFDLDTINRIRAIDPSMPTGYLVLSCDEPIDAVATCIDHGHVAVHPYDLFVDRALVERCHAVGVAVNVWTVDQPDRIAELLTFGVDAVISNRVDVALAVRART